MVELRLSRLAFVSWIFLCGIHVSRAQCPNAVKKLNVRLRQDLLCNYDKLSRPVKNSSSTLLVSFAIDLKKLEMDEHRQQTMDLEAHFRIWWVDEYLVWSREKYDNISYMRVDDLPVWLPDLTLNVISQNSGKDIRPNQCTVSYQGVVTCLPKLQLTAPCRQDVRRWPFEEHECTLEISSFLYYDHQMSLAASKMKDTSLMKNREWDLRETKLVKALYNITTKQGQIYYPVMVYNLKINRHAGFCAASTVLPAIMLLTIVLNTFWLGNMLSSRLTCLGFVIFSCSMYLSYLMYLVPANGPTVPVIVTLFRDCYALATFGIIVATTVKRLSVAEAVPPLWLTSITDRVEASILGRILFITNATPLADDEAAIIEPSAKPNLWIAQAVLLDRLSFISCLIVTLTLLMGYLPY